jgi:hypothetical protein
VPASSLVRRSALRKKRRRPRLISRGHLEIRFRPLVINQLPREPRLGSQLNTLLSTRILAEYVWK